jgi:hypothetical protein
LDNVGLVLDPLLWILDLPRSPRARSQPASRWHRRQPL